jgi:AbrB family looped-hinge helix DNA binding protein
MLIFIIKWDIKETVVPIVTQKWQVTVSKKIRDKLGIHPGDEILFEMNEGRIFLKKKDPPSDFKKYVGFLCKQGHDSEQVVHELRNGL